MTCARPVVSHACRGGPFAANSSPLPCPSAGSTVQRTPASVDDGDIRVLAATLPSPLYSGEGLAQFAPSPQPLSHKGRGREEEASFIPPDPGGAASRPADPASAALRSRRCT